MPLVQSSPQVPVQKDRHSEPGGGGSLRSEVAAVRAELTRRDRARGGDSNRASSGESPGRLAAQTAQHAQRQGVAAARNVAASLGVMLSGVLAKLAGRAYHLVALPSERLRVLSAWINAAISGPQVIELGLIDARSATIQASKRTSASSAIADSHDV